MAASEEEEPSTRRVSEEIEGSISAFSRKNGVTEAQTRQLIARWGNDHSILTAQASQLRTSGG